MSLISAIFSRKFQLCFVFWSFFFFFGHALWLVGFYFSDQGLSLAVKAWSPNHWPTREFPGLFSELF